MTKGQTYVVMIQDVNPKNARIYFDGYMYVGGYKHLASPDYFAPYFIKPCLSDPKLAEVAKDGVSQYSKVVHVRCINVAQLIKDPESAIDNEIRRHEHWKDGRWKRGLKKISERAEEEKPNPPTLKAWSEENDPHRLYFLETPTELGRTIKKAGQRQLMHGYGCSYADLMEMRDLNNRGRS